MGEPGPCAQGDAGVRFEWGATGAGAIAGPDAAVVVVDVLSFTTAVTVAVRRGTTVWPHPWPSPDVASVAAAHDAEVAVPRRAVDRHHPWSLSPAHLRDASAVDRLVLPSPNGSAIAAVARAGAVVAACLRNASSAARWLADHGYGHRDRPVAVIAAGERWPDGSLRPALEDLLGAGAVVAALPHHLACSPEATSAEAVWLAHRHHLARSVAGCASGRELAQAGWAGDVAVAAEHDVETTVPVLVDGAFRPADRLPGGEVTARRRTGPWR